MKLGIGTERFQKYPHCQYVGELDHVVAHSVAVFNSSFTTLAFGSMTVGSYVVKQLSGTFALVLIWLVTRRIGAGDFII